MSAALSRDPSPNLELVRRRTPVVVLVGPPVLTRRRVEGRLIEAPRMVIGADGNWQDMTTRLAAACNPGIYEACGCKKNACNCGMKDAASDYAQPGEPCVRPRWVPLTISNPVVVAALGQGTATYSPQAPFKLARMTLSAAQAADFTAIQIQVGDRPNVIPTSVDGTYFSVASNQDGDGRVDAPICYPGQQIVITFTSTAGVAALAARFTLQGAYAAQMT